MPRALSYADAVRVLGGDQPNKIVTALDRLCGGALLVASAGGSGLALSLFDAKSEFFRLTDQLVSGLTGRLRNKGRAERGDQVAAAHSVIVVAAFFDVMAAVRLPFAFDDLGLSSCDGLTLALLRVPVPVPAPHRPYERSIEELREFYDGTAREVLGYLAGLEVWDRLDDRERRAAEHALRVGEQAVVRYEGLFRRLATDFPEVAFWANLVDHQATRTEIGHLKTALAGVCDVLEQLSAGREADQHRQRLAKYHQGVLRRPLLPVAPEGVRLPLVVDAYVNPHFRVAAGGPKDSIADEGWWDEQPVRTDLQEFLIGHLTSPGAAEAPLVVLGQPGAGKSMLTKVLAARMPASEFVAVPVPLRDVSADHDVQTQVEHGLRITTGDRPTWREFVRSIGDAVPVVLLDGFDELLQATRVSQSNYLDTVAEFQTREALLGHPVIVIVTSRVSVADRTRPVEGMVTLLLEPFTDRQIEQWLVPWCRANGTDLTLKALRPHEHLARQPLLLLLLAIYDRTEERLAQHGDSFGQTVLYDRLLSGFSRREVRKEHANASDDELDRLVDEQMLRLSVAAFAMFNRGRQWVSEEELDADLAALTDKAFGARVVIGSFYFIHTAQAINGSEVRVRTYEFLHPTFGEYLIARLTVLTLVEEPWKDDVFLHALLSFAPLTERKTVARFVINLVDSLGKPCVRLRGVLLSLFHNVLLPRAASVPGYQPGSWSVPTRYAMYSANLCLLLVWMAPHVVTADELFPNAEDPVSEWAKMATLWMSQLPAEGRHGLVEALHLVRSWEGGRRVLHISSRGDDRRQQADPFWTYRISPPEVPPRELSYRGWTRLGFETVSAELEFLCSVEGDTASHALSPFLEEHGSMVTTFYAFGDAAPVSAAQALITLWLKADGEAGIDELTEAYYPCMMWAVDGFAPFDAEVRARFRVLFLNQLQRLRGRLPGAAIDDTVRAMLRTGGSEIPERDDLLSLTRAICPGLLQSGDQGTTSTGQ
ncbi:hypothetical protein [Lentzea sp. NPDC003310]|uniref:NACHT domain-containing protein n=1 Tax=Lentzea sp. NPDC003310 TaxID=3154447 RepID=UPI0033AA5E65